MRKTSMLREANRGRLRVMSTSGNRSSAWQAFYVEASLQDLQTSRLFV